MPAAGSPQGAGRSARGRGRQRRRNPCLFGLRCVRRYGRSAREGKRRRANRIGFYQEKRKGVFGGGGRGNARKRSEPGFKTEGRHRILGAGIFHIRSYGIRKRRNAYYLSILAVEGPHRSGQSSPSSTSSSSSSSEFFFLSSFFVSAEAFTGRGRGGLFR